MNPEIVESIGGLIVGLALTILMVTYAQALKRVQYAHPNIWASLNSQRKFGVVMPSTLNKELTCFAKDDASIQGIQKSYKRGKTISLIIGILGAAIGTFGAAYYATYLI